VGQLGVAVISCPLDDGLVFTFGYDTHLIAALVSFITARTHAYTHVSKGVHTVDCTCAVTVDRTHSHTGEEVQRLDEVNEEEKKEMEDEEVALKESQENPESESQARGITRTYSRTYFLPNVPNTN
jgi:hypothetical protein